MVSFVATLFEGFLTVLLPIFNSMPSKNFGVEATEEDLIEDTDLARDFRSRQHC